MSNVPPLKLFAAPTDETVMSRVCPGCAKDGKLAVTTTPATFFACKLAPAGVLIPIWVNIFVIP